MVDHKLVDGVKVVLSDAEIAQRQAEETAWNAGAFDRAINNLRQRRNALLSASDWTILSDSPVQDKYVWQSYRQSLRDLTEGLSTVEQVNSVVFPTKP
jgi:hypothetical protein